MTHATPARIGSNGHSKPADSRSVQAVTLPNANALGTHAGNGSCAGGKCIENAERVGLMGRSVAHRQLLWNLGHVAQVDIEVFFVGETGVGKELYARYVHECSPRAAGEFVAINCGAIPDALFENELFGHSAGAYTDARARSDGLVAAAEGGTLFLDEVDGLPKAAQVKLLRLLQQKEYRRLGETRLRRANFRVISAMNRNPQQAIEDGSLRQDLFYRLCVTAQQIPPLRERPDDIDLLADEFARRYSEEYARQEPLEFTSAAKRLLCAYPWPGNIRQLENVIRSLACQHPDAHVEAEGLPIVQPQQSDHAYVLQYMGALLCLPFSEAKRRLVDQFEVEYVREMLRRADGNICQAAKLASKNRRRFFEVMRLHKIRADEFKTPSANQAGP